VAAAALSQVGVRFHPQGRLKGAALDCVGLAVVAAEGAGVCLAGPLDYDVRRGDYGGTLLDHVRQACDQVPELEMAQPGDFVLIFLRDPADPRHLAVVVEGDQQPLDLVHAAPRYGCVVRQGLDQQHRNHIHSVWRLKG